MKRIAFISLLLINFSALPHAYAQVSETFNTRAAAGTIGEIKDYLQENCWVLSGTDINLGGWNAAIEGDGALVSPLGAGETTGIYSPVLQVPGNLYISFTYKFNANVSAGHLLRIALTSYDN